MITEGEAIELARRACIGKAEIHTEAPIETVRDDDRYVVTFVRLNPPGVRGPDYDAQVTLDAETGEVLKILGAQ